MNKQSTFSIPLVSVIIPTYNRGELVQEAIESVLSQTYKDFELIIVDDGSTDGTGDVLQARYGEKIRYIRQENKGGPVARNLGISLAKGKYIAFLDSDDLWLTEKLSCQVPVLEDNPDIALVICQAWQIDITGKKLSDQPLGVNTTPLDFSIENLLINNKIPAGASTFLIRRSVLDRVGGFSGDIRFGAEWDLWLRIAGDAVMFIVPRPLAAYRRHKKTLSYFPEIKYVDDMIADRLVMFQRMRNSFPEKISKHNYDMAVAHQYFVASMASYMLGEIEKGQQRLKIAFDLDPVNWNNVDYFSNWIVIFSISYVIDQNGDFSPKLCTCFIDNLCENLPEIKNKVISIRRTKSKIQIQLGILDYQAGRKMDSFMNILKGILLAPQLISLELLAILAEPILGHGLVDRLRSFRHSTKSS